MLSPQEKKWGTVITWKMSDEEAFVSTLYVSHAELKSTAGDKARFRLFLSPLLLFLMNNTHFLSVHVHPSACSCCFPPSMHHSL